MTDEVKGCRLSARVQCRLTEREHEEVREQARLAGMTLSRYFRQRLLGRKVMASADRAVIAELRRLGGLAKHLHVASEGAYRQATAGVVRDIGRCIDRIARG